MPSHALDVRDTRVLDLLQDTRAMAVWEMLRRVHTPSTVSELSEWAGMTSTVTQSHLNRLARFGLVETVPAGGRRKAVAWRVTRERLVLAGSSRDAVDRALIKRFQEDRQESFDRIFGSGTAFERTCHANELFEFLCAPVCLNDLEVEELRRRLGEVIHFLKLVQSKHNGVRARPMPRCSHYVTVRVQPIARGTLPQPDLTVAPRGQVPPAELPEPGARWGALSPREREVAIALVSGATLPEIARKLGRSQHTVSELTRRLYRKLGVRRRAQLVQRLRIVDGPPVA